jgi:ribosomal protein L16 Arg81 hydroxylase
MTRATTLGRILHPLSVDEFATDYFQQRPLFIRGHPRKFAFVFAQREFALDLDRVSEIRAVFRDLWQAQIHPVDIKEMMLAGASICVTGMEKAHPRLQRAAKAIKSELGYGGTVSFRAYLSPPKSGFDLHFDARVATTLQVAGTKRWWYSREPALAFPKANSPHPLPAFSSEYKMPPISNLRSVLLRPGDLLCLPAGVWHRARAKTTSLALNLAFDHYGAGMFDFIVAMLERRLEKDPVWRVPLPVSSSRLRRTTAETVVKMARVRIDALQKELSAIRADEQGLRKALLNNAESRLRP